VLSPLFIDIKLIEMICVFGVSCKKNMVGLVEDYDKTLVVF
jgi:hypothetical protein